MDPPPSDTLTALAHPVPGGSPVSEHASHPLGSTREVLRGLIGRMHAALPGSDLEVLIRIILTEGRRLPALVETYHRESIALGSPVLGTVLARGAERGEVGAGAVAELPLVLVALNIMEVVWRMTIESLRPVALAAWLAAPLELVLEGVLLV